VSRRRSKHRRVISIDDAASAALEGLIIRPSPEEIGLESLIDDILDVDFSRSRLTSLSLWW